MGLGLIADGAGAAVGTVVVGDPGAPVVAQSGDSDCLAGKLRAALGAVDDGIVAARSGAGGGDLVLDIFFIKFNMLK